MRERSSISPEQAPPASLFPDHPASWYLFGPSAGLARGPWSKELLGKRLVAFRTESGAVAVLDAHCAHLGADLGCGEIVGETIQCPFHHWRYGRDGVCAHATGCAAPPAFARLQTYAAEERHGYLFFFNGPRALFPLPFFLDESPEAFVAGKAFHYVADCNWYMNAAHAFDMQHFLAVHDRRLVAPPQVDCPLPFARRNRYRAEVVGGSVYDRILRTFAGDVVEISITVFGGPFVLVTGDFGRVMSRFLIATRPLPDGRTLCEGIVFARRGRIPLLDRPGLWLRRLFTHGYLAAESRRLRGTRYQPRGLGAADGDLIAFFQWLVSLQPLTRGGAHADLDRAAAAVTGDRGLRMGAGTALSSPAAAGVLGTIPGVER
jgi:nitrite reductase/ring-hydroxylating ferredoxin subunit